MERRLLGILTVTYWLLLLYASLAPFDLSASEEQVQANWHHAWQLWPFGPVRGSRPDMLSNAVVYVPLGFLVATRWIVRRRLPAALAVAGGAVVAAVTSVVAEVGQMCGLSRVPSAQDVLMNSIGGFLGAVAGGLWGRRAWTALVQAVHDRLKRRPVSLLVALLVLMLAFDALVPLLPTIDVGEVKRGLKGSEISLMAGLAKHAWHHWVIQKGAVYAVLTGLLAAAGLRRRGAWARAALMATGLAVGLEMCKPFIVSRYANIANVVVAAAGVLTALLASRLPMPRVTMRLKLLAGALLLAGYLTYTAWTPFTFVWDTSAAAGKLPRGAEWLPLYHYAHGGRAEDVRLFLRTLTLVGALSCLVFLAGMSAPSENGDGYGFCPATRSVSRNLAEIGNRPGFPWRRLVIAGVATGLFGLVLEGGQLFIHGRVPSVTDVFLFASAGALGVWAGNEYLRRRQEVPPALSEGTVESPQPAGPGP